MKNDYYYQPSSEKLNIMPATILLALMTLTPTVNHKVDIIPAVIYENISSANMQSGVEFYATAVPLTESDQFKVIEIFAYKLLADTVELPQEMEDFLHEHFWELV